MSISELLYVLDYFGLFYVSSWDLQEFASFPMMWSYETLECFLIRESQSLVQGYRSPYFTYFPGTVF